MGTEFKKLDEFKNASDAIVYKSAEFKLLFGTDADTTNQAKFKVVKLPGTTMSDNEIKSKIISAFNTYFDVKNWDYGETFYFTELAAYIHNQLAPDLLTAVIVPNQAGQTFGSLFQVSSAADEIFISGATVDDVSIISALGANQLLASGTVVT